MKSLNTSWNRKVIVLDNSMTFGNLRISNSKLKYQNGCEYALNKLSMKEQLDASSCKDVTDYADDGSNTMNDDTLNIESCKNLWTWNSNELSQTGSKRQTQSIFTSGKEKISNTQTINVGKSESSGADISSDESFSTLVPNYKYNNNFINPKNNSSKPLRVYNKNGKPLTDRFGQPLADILGQPLVVFDENGRLISDSKGNQIFNCLGESAAFSNTNLFVSPTEEETGLPLLDIDKKHILYLYDSKGHPMTDSLGRPLVKASGSLMFGLSQREKENVDSLKLNELKNVFGKAALENCVRHIQIFDGDFKALTDENGKLFKNSKIFCNKSGMPVCDAAGRPCSFKYGSRIMESSQYNCENVNGDQSTATNTCEPQDKGIISGSKIRPNSASSLTTIEDRFKRRRSDSVIVYKESSSDSSFIETKIDGSETLYRTNFDQTSQNIDNVDKLCLKTGESAQEEENISIEPNISNKNSKLTSEDQNQLSPRKQKNNNSTRCKHEFDEETIYNKNQSKEAIVLFDGSKKMSNRKSLMNTLAFKTFKGKRKERIGHSVWKRKPYKEMFKSNFMEYFKNAVNFTAAMPDNNNMLYNDYGKPIKDMYGNLLYDKYGIPMTGANGVKLSEQARHALRLKLRNIPLIPINKINQHDKENIKKALTFNQSMDQFGQPNYDKHGRPLYDLFGKLIYDSYGRPLTDAFGRPLIDPIGQPMMDSKGNVLTSITGNSNSDEVTDVFGRPLYDKKGRALFDSYGRPRFDIFTNAIYDTCGRPVTDGNGNLRYDFLNQPIKPHPEKPLYKNAKTLLPRYIDQILTAPSMHIILKYSRTLLKDAFGGPLFDDFGRPMYNKIGKAIYDKYGRPLYRRDGKPLCDCYGRPLSEEICQSPDDTTLSVVDSLKLLKLTKESSKWMEIKRSEMQTLKDTKSQVLDDAFIMKVIQPTRKKSTQYTYALTRVTKFSSGRQALEILEAPLSPATASEMHHLPVDNKPLIMMAKRHQRISKRRKPAVHK